MYIIIHIALYCIIHMLDTVLNVIIFILCAGLRPLSTEKPLVLSIARALGVVFGLCILIVYIWKILSAVAGY